MTDTILSCRGVSKKFGHVQALDQFSCDIGRGKIVGLLGPNGSGKTTLIKLATSLLTPDEGEITIGGMAPSVETKKIISYLPERTYFNETMQVGDLIAFFSDF